jgi:Xaa-Pro aminopeptidase
LNDLFIKPEEYKVRIERLKTELQQHSYEGFFVTDPTYVFWLTGFVHVPTERPFGILIPVEGECAVVLPRLERWHWEERIPWINDISDYLDYPGPSPREDFNSYDVVSNMIKSRIRSGKIAVDSLGMAYHAPKEMQFFKTPYGHGPGLREHLTKTLDRVQLVDKSEILTEWMLVLSETEQKLVREANDWGFKVHEIAYELIAPGKTPFEICFQATLEAYSRLIKPLGPEYEPLNIGEGYWPPYIVFSAGPPTAYPHGGSLGDRHRKIRLGDNCISASDPNIGGYGPEIERTFFVGKPNSKQIKYWNIMRKAQNTAFQIVREGNTCADVCNAAYRVFIKEGVWDAVLHHCGHGKPWKVHVPPYLDPGDKTELRSGMLFSLEPGLYFRGFGGFRFSDTFIVTPDGAEWVTKQLLTIEENTTCR